jgi:hypothetical protein
MRERLDSCGGNTFLHHFVNDLGGGFVVSRRLRKNVIDSHIRQPHKARKITKDDIDDYKENADGIIKIIKEIEENQ